MIFLDCIAHQDLSKQKEIISYQKSHQILISGHWEQKKFLEPSKEKSYNRIHSKLREPK